MRIETRNTFGLRALILIPESSEESLLIDSVVGANVGEDGLIANVEGQVRLADGYGEHYIRLERKK